MTMSLESPSFRSGSEIPLAHTCDTGVSSALAWSAVPRETKSLVLIAEDLDTQDARTPDQLFVHWVLYNIQPSEPGLALGISASELAPGISIGLNSRGETGYAAPWPAAGTGVHRYACRLDALDSTLPKSLDLTPADLRRRMEGRVLDVAELIGTSA